MSIPIGAVSSVNALIGKAFKQPKGDFAERLNSRITVVILALSSVLLGSSHFWGNPITCWSPAQYTKQWTDFVDQYCYVHGTYFVPLNETMAHTESERRKQPVNYYQWVPYILATQALLFYMPRFLWKSLCSYSGYDLSGAVRYVDDFWNAIKNNDASFKTRIAQFEGRPAVFIWDGIRLARRKNGRDMAFYYALSTVVQSFNAWCQWMWLNGFLQSPTYKFWGPNVLYDLFNGDDWQTTGHFPRVTHCDFFRRSMSTTVESVLCVLHLNIYYEKICLFLWFWLLFVAIVSFSNSLFWLTSLCIRKKAEGKVTDFLSTAPDAGSYPSRDRFCRILGRDGLFVLQQMSTNLGDIPSSYLTIAMRNCCEQFEESVNEDLEDRYLIKPAAKAV